MPPEAVADNVAVPPLQMVAAPDILVAGSGTTVTVRVFEVAILQSFPDAEKRQRKFVLDDNALVIKLGLLVPALTHVLPL